MKLKKLIKDIQFSRNFYDEEFQKIIILPHVSLDDDFILESLIDANELVLIYDKYKILIDYPLDGFQSFELEKPTKNGTTRIELLNQLKNIYIDKFKIDSESKVNLKHYITFVLNSVSVYELENGEIVLRLIIST